MFGPSKNTVVSAGLVCILALGALGCSASVESSTKIEVSTTDENGTTTTTTTESTSGVSTEDGATSTTTTQTSTVVDLDGWSAAWKGDTNKGFTAYYAQAPEESDQALIAVYDPKTEEITSCIGSYTMLDKNVLVITDAGSGKTFQFTILEETSNGAKLDLGDEFGIADTKPVSFADFAEELRAIDVNHVVFDM